MFFILEVAFLIIYTPHPRERVFSVYGLLLSFFSAPFLTIISATFWTGLVSNAFSICAPLAKWQIQFRSVPHWHGDKFNFDLCPTGMVTNSISIFAPLAWWQFQFWSLPNCFCVRSQTWAPTTLVSKPNFNLSLDFTRSGDPPARFPRHEDAHTPYTQMHMHTPSHTDHTHRYTCTHTQSRTHTHTHTQLWFGALEPSIGIQLV